MNAVQQVYYRSVKWCIVTEMIEIDIDSITVTFKAQECTLMSVQSVKAFVFSADNVFSTLNLWLACYVIQIDCNILSKLIIIDISLFLS